MDKCGRKSDQPIYSPLTDCSYLQELGQLYSLHCVGDTVDFSISEHLVVKNNNWPKRSFL